jgi:hypothetical protein
MAAKSCVLFPTIKGKKSQLYVDIYNRTGKDRPLTNFLYGLSKSESIKAKFNSKDFNSQKELKSKVFLDFVDIDKLISDKDKLDAARAELDADTVYKTPEEILDKVLVFNEEHSDLKAKIHFTGEGFTIDVANLNADNYNANKSLKRRSVEYSTIVGWLNSQTIGGRKMFNTDFSDLTKLTIANTLQAYGFKKTLISLIRAAKGSDFQLNDRVLSLVMDLFAEHPLMQRIKDHYGDLTPTILSYASGAIPGLPEGIEYDSYWRGEVTNLLYNIKRTLSKMKEKDLIAAVETATADYSDDSTYYGVSSDEIESTLNELYDLYHLDKDDMKIDMAEATKLSEVAETFLNNKKRELEILKRKSGELSPEERKKIDKLEKDIAKGKYGESIIDMLSDLAGLINSSNDQISAVEMALDDNPSALATINNICASVMSAIDLERAYAPILSRLLDMSKYEKDELGLSPEVINQIEELAAALNNKLTALRNNAKDNQKKAVIAFFTLYWGNKDKSALGEVKSLESIVEIAQNGDINFFDRMLLSFNQSNDEALGLLYAAVRDRQVARDKKAREGDFIIRTITDDLFKTGSSTDFMYERDKDGKLTGRIITDIDWDKYEHEREAYRNHLVEEGYSRKNIAKMMDKWDSKHTMWVEPSDSATYRNAYAEYLKTLISPDATPEDYKFKVRIPNASYRKTMPSMTIAQREYYNKMLALKAVLQQGLPTAEYAFFDAPQLSASMTDALKESGGNPVKVLEALKHQLGDILQKREDDEDYGETYYDMLEGNDITIRESDMDGNELMRLPLFFTHRIKDTARLSTDFSRGMEAIMTSSVNYRELNKAMDALLLTKDWLQKGRDIQATEGGRKLVDVFTWGGDMALKAVTLNKGTSGTGAAVQDFFEANVYNKRHKDGQSGVTIMGHRITTDKLASALTGYTSTVGLAANLLGAQANLLVGKLQMVIEASCGEFFTVKDWGVAELQYFQMLGPLLNELASNNKSSELGLLMDYFNVEGDFIDNLKRSGMYNSTVGKIINNSNLLFMYGMGEHMLHAETMLAILNQKKVIDKTTGNTVPLKEVFKVEKVGKNGKIVIDYDRYNLITDEKTGASKPLTEADIDLVNNQIKYCNDSMHGAFSQIDRGMIHRYCFGRLIMNFRQWMPAHYARRFKGLHYDALLGQYREGYYVSCYKFLRDTVKAWKDAEYSIAIHWHELDDTEQGRMQKANIKRAMAETALLISLMASPMLLGRYKDKKGNWAYRNLMYQLYRMKTEVGASSPVALTGFIKNALTILNSPMACISTVDNMTRVLYFHDLFYKVEAGKHEGENLYVHGLEKAIPYYRQVMNQLNLGNEDTLFKIFD